MNKNRPRIDKVRASRDGHEFHEAWAARRALQLVMPTDGLVGIAVEGLAPADQPHASAETVEIADLVLYYGKRPTFDGARSVVIVQVKYSKSSQSAPYRASDGKKTIRKFAAAYRSHKRTHGAKAVEKKLTFELITNRPIYGEFAKAIDGLASGISLKGDAKRQATQFTSASGLRDKELAQFAQKVRITGLSGSLRQNKQSLSRVLADWSVAPDAMARARLGNMRQLLRDKAGLAGEGQNIITRTDVLDALELQSPEDLFPCPASFPEIGNVVKREQLSRLVSRIPQLNKPLLIHSDGGVGKTVFLQSLAKVLGETHETVLFDCFGGGAYRAPEDGRHLPKRGLIHIINNLACHGLCDPLLPINENVEELVKAFRLRVSQAVATLQRGLPDKQLLLFIDAVDNAAEHAKDKGESAFPTLLLESFHHAGPVAGVQLIVSCRTYRRVISRGDIPRDACEEFLLKPFSPAETEKYLRHRIPNVTDAQIQVAYSRSEGNPRILEHLALSDRGLLDKSEINNVIKLDDFLKGQIRKAIGEALRRGYKELDINAFLAGLSVLPPPVPLDEYADAHGMDLSVVKSFAADLAPMLEQTRHGLMFRDEPTETLVRENYAAKSDTLRALAENLFKKQGTSVYAASALPDLLQKLDDGKLLFNLAFDERFPVAITSTVGKQNIRYARLKAAVRHAARKEDFDRLVHLLVELSTLAAINQRGTEYVLDNPDLVIASHDVDATRRLFETRTPWPGTRYARLTVASVLSGDLTDAYRHVVQADDWIHHFYRQGEDYRRDKGGPERLDIASVPLCLVGQDRGPDAAQFMKGWKDWFAYEVSEHVFMLLQQAERMGTVPTANIRRFLDSLNSQPGVLAAALSFLQLDNAGRRRLIRELARDCENKKPIENSQTFYHERDYLIQDGFLKAAAMAVAMKMHTEALGIVETIPHQRPNLWSFTDRFSNKDAFHFVAYTALRAAVEGLTITGHKLLPQELIDIGERVPKGTDTAAFKKSIKAEMEERSKPEPGLPDQNKRISYETKRDAERFIDERLEPLLELTQTFATMLSVGSGKADKQFLELMNLWTKFRMKRERYSDAHETNWFFDLLGRQLLAFALWARRDLKDLSVEVFVSKLSEHSNTPISTLIEVVAMLAKRPELQEVAGRVALSAKALIERDDEVSRRASLFAQLSRAIMPASVEETASYFRLGLEQMDAIGSGDYQFTSELLVFAGALRGEELEEVDFHTLSNICELNIYDEDKFPWLDFARALARTSGCRSLAKLARWDDRDKSSLDYTLLPYLFALIEQDKIDPSIALGLLRISAPVELYVCGTEQLAKVLADKKYQNSEALLTELIFQFEQTHPGVFMPSTLATLQEIAEREIGKDSEIATYLSVAAPKFEKLRNEENESRNYHGTQYLRSAEGANVQEEENRRALRKIVDQTDLADEASVSRAIDELNSLHNVFDLKGEFFENLRGKLKYEERLKYVQMISRLETLDIYTKLRELKECKEKWGSSSAALEEVFLDIGVPFIQIHAADLVHHDYLSNSTLRDISQLSGIPLPVLVLELIFVFAQPDSHLPASVWMSLASIVCQKAKRGEGQIALKRLLNSNAAKLASTVVDGIWKEGLYPKSGETDIAAGVVWRCLGSPSAAQRWRAAHSIRCFARFGKWEVIDALIGRFHSTDAHTYQAPELPFYFLHARLWLLIAIARVAMDHPQNVMKYADALKAIALDQGMPHVLMRHFAARAVLACAKGGSIPLPESDAKALKKINDSLFPSKKTKEYERDSFYHGRPDSMPEPAFEFNLDFDFDKSDVAQVSRMFERSRWETRDSISTWVRKYDPQIESMYKSGGRSARQRDGFRGITKGYHLYGAQLGWHALYLTAGEFLAKYPVVQGPYDDSNPWREWLRRESLTRSDGLWLADGVDRPPVDAQVNLYEKAEQGRALTGDNSKVLSLLKIQSFIGEELVVAGDWRSADGIEIRITSALVPVRDAKKVALQLSQEDPFRMWLPRVEENEGDGEYSHSENEPCKPWIVWPYVEAGLDEADSLGVTAAVRRLYFSKAINAISSLRAVDPFKRTWVDPTARVAVRSEAWGRNPRNDEQEAVSAERLVCSSRFLKDVLVKRRSDLLVLVVLRRYDKGSGSRDSQHWHTTAVVRIDKTLDFELFSGAVNQPHVIKY
jgi:hypothetical protein